MANRNQSCPLKPNNDAKIMPRDTFPNKEESIKMYQGNN